MKRKLLPQITRFFSAKKFQYLLALLFWFGLAALLGYNVQMLQNQPRLAPAEILSRPLEADAHVRFARLLWDNNLAEAAIRELLIADSLKKDLNQKLPVLGDSTGLIDLVEIWKSGPEKIRRHYLYWSRLAEEKPDYRDAHIIAGLLAYQLGKTESANEHLLKARTLDPNHPVLRDLVF